MLSACASSNDFRLFTAEELYEIMPAKVGELSEDGAYIRCATSTDIAFAINDLDRFDASEYKYMVVGARTSKGNNGSLGAYGYMWYNDNPAFGARYEFTTSFKLCKDWYSTTPLPEGETFGKVQFNVTQARREDKSANGIDYSRGIASLVLLPYHAENETIDISYIAFFKTQAEANAFDPNNFDSSKEAAHTPYNRETKPVIILKFDDLGKQELGANGLEIVKATYDDYQKDPVRLGEFSFDGNPDTYWYCEGKTDRIIVYELEETATVKSASIVWFAESAPYEIYTSLDNVDFTLAAEGTSPKATGENQTVNINKEAKFIKVVTKYNNVNYDHGISEISFTK